MTSVNATKIILLILSASIFGGAGYLIGSRSRTIESQSKMYSFTFTDPDQWESICLSGPPPYIVAIRITFPIRDAEYWPNLWIWPTTNFEQYYPTGYAPRGLLIWPKLTPYDYFLNRYEGENMVRESYTITTQSELTIHLHENPPAEVTLFIK